MTCRNRFRENGELPIPLFSMSDTLPDVWTLTPVDGNTRELYTLMSLLGGSNCNVNIYERRGGLRGRFDFLLSGMNDEERFVARHKIERLGLRLVLPEELLRVEQEPYCPVMDRADPPVV